MSEQEERLRNGERADVLFYVQHLLGVGHLRRANELVAGLRRGGLTVVMVSGGPPVPNLPLAADRLVYLPPVMVRDENFVLVDGRGKPVGDALKEDRRKLLLDSYEAWRPRIVITELFPFGRRQMRFELLPLIERARQDEPRPLILTSLRDILNQQKKEEKKRWMLETFDRLFDRALVHGDENFLTLAESFPEVAPYEPRLDYTGYVSAPCDKGPVPNSEVLISAGGGAVGEPLARAALAAYPLSELNDRLWRILLGHNLDEKRFADLQAAAPPGVIVERARPDFLTLLAGCALSVSQAGYNTVVEVLARGRPAVFVPFAAGGESEQSLRCAHLQEKGLAEILPENEMTGETLAGAMTAAVAKHRDGTRQLDFAVDGADQSAKILRDLLREQSA